MFGVTVAATGACHRDFDSFPLAAVVSSMHTCRVTRHPALLAVIASLAISCASSTSSSKAPNPSSTTVNFTSYTLSFDSSVDLSLQRDLERIDSDLRQKFSMTPADTAVGLLDLRTLRLAMIHPDRGEYAASIPKIGILLAWFHTHPEAGSNLPPDIRRELGLMIKASDNEMAAKFSSEIGLKEIQRILNDYGFYDPRHGGGIWVGKHYGQSSERYGDPVGDNSHAATVRQLLRFFLLLEQRKLISPAASDTMREIFLSPNIPHDQIKFVQGLAGENVAIIRKWGSWENWLHDAALVTGPRHHYILVALTHHPAGDQYLVELARLVHNLLSSSGFQAND